MPRYLAALEHGDVGLTDSSDLTSSLSFESRLVNNQLAQSASQLSWQFRRRFASTCAANSVSQYHVTTWLQRESATSSPETSLIMIEGSSPAKVPPSALRIEGRETPKNLTTHSDHHMQYIRCAPPTPNSSSFEEEEKRGRKRRRRISLDMAKRSADTALGLRELSLPPSPATREPSRKRSQSPSKARNELERCKPAVIHKSAGYQPQHPTTKARIKKFVQMLSDESCIFTAAEKVRVVVLPSSQPSGRLTFINRLTLRMMTRTGHKLFEFPVRCYSIPTM